MEKKISNSKKNLLFKRDIHSLYKRRNLLKYRKKKTCFLLIKRKMFLRIYLEKNMKISR
jgi:hypothetical protein